MSKLSKDTKFKIENITRNQLPAFASSFIRVKSNSLKESSLLAYAFDLVSFFEYLSKCKSIPVKELTINDFIAVTVEDIENYIEYSKCSSNNMKPRSEAAVYRRYVILSSFYNFLYTEGVIESLPILRVSPPRYMKKAPTPPPKADTARLLDFVSNESFSSKHAADYQEICRSRDLAIIVLISYAGLRTSECSKLDIDDLHLDEGYIVVKDRLYPHLTVSTYVIQCISEYLKERLETLPVYGDEQALFLSLRGNRISQRGIQVMIKKYSSATFGDEKSILGKDLSYSFKNRVYNTSKSISTAAILGGNSPNTLYKTYKADLNERTADTAHIDPI